MDNNNIAHVHASKPQKERWVIYNIYDKKTGDVFRIKDTATGQTLKAEFKRLEDAWEILEILTEYERNGTHAG